MTIEYVLLLFAMFFLVLKGFSTAPANAFKEAGPRLGARVERQLETGGGFLNNGQTNAWGATQ